MPTDSYIAVGSNVSPRENIVRALEMLQRRVNVRGVSTFYRTPPLKRPEQPEYRNGVFWVRTDLSPRALKFDVLRQTEEGLGRVRTEDAYAARTIDLDLILYGDRMTNSDELVLPDPDIRARAFVAVPLLELAPALRLPDSGEALADIVNAAMCQDLEPDHELTDTLRARISNESTTH
jgi:2-amino-4-hydroxy-6-hydroxymethyldihydropteridine diphosphokinase